MASQSATANLQWFHNLAHVWCFTDEARGSTEPAVITSSAAHAFFTLDPEVPGHVHHRGQDDYSH